MSKLLSELRKKSSAEKAVIYQRFFKTGKGQYGEGDVFLGLTVPETREIAKKFLDLDFNEIKKSLDSVYHEERLAALFVLVELFKGSDEKKRKEIFNFYLENTGRINNWDLVDTSAHKIIGEWLLDKDRKVLYRLASSDNLWERRISIISTYQFIKNNQFGDTLKISEILLEDKHDLMHKAVGWMLREVGKKDERVLKKFLEENYKKMPRTALRYAIERFPEGERKEWLRKT